MTALPLAQQVETLWGLDQISSRMLTIGKLGAARTLDVPEDGRHGGRPYKMTTAKLRLARAAMGQPETKVGDLSAELGITRQTLYRFVSPAGDLRADGERLLQKRKATPT